MQVTTHDPVPVEEHKFLVCVVSTILKMHRAIEPLWYYVYEVHLDGTTYVLLLPLVSAGVSSW